MAERRTEAPEDKKCHLLAIPPELRLRIYGYLFASLQTQAEFQLNPSRSLTQYHRGEATGRKTALLSVCKLIRCEAEPVFYDCVSITIKNYTPGQGSRGSRTLDACSYFLSRVGRVRISLWLDDEHSGFPKLVRDVVKILGSQRQVPMHKVFLDLDFEEDEDEVLAGDATGMLMLLRCRHTRVSSFQSLRNGPLQKAARKLLKRIDGATWQTWDQYLAEWEEE